jgi:uroporphyrinogen-III synthase
VTATLAGLTVIVARDDAPDDDVSAAIIAAGGVVVPLPLMRVVPPLDVRPLHDAIARLNQPAPWAAIVFTSRHAVAAVAMHASAPPDVVVAAVGDATARALQGHGWPVHVVGDGGGAALAARLVAAVDVAGRRVLWPRAEDAHDALRPALEAAGAIVDDVVAYRAVAVVDAARIASVPARRHGRWPSSSPAPSGCAS